MLVDRLRVALTEAMRGRDRAERAEILRAEAAALAAHLGAGLSRGVGEG